MSSSESREIAVKKYFTKTPEPPGESNHVAWFVIGAFGAVLGLGLMAMENGIGIVILIAGGWCLWQGLSNWSTYSDTKSNYDKAYAEAEPKPSDEQMDAWLDRDIRRLTAEAVDKLDLLPEQIFNENKEPIKVVGPSRNADLAVGKDDIIRFSKYDLVLVYLTDYHLAAYKATLDMAQGTTTSESTQEYHYTDVVSVATQTEGSDLFAVMVNGEKKPVNSYQKFALSVASGERIEVVVGFPQLSDIVKQGKLSPTGADKAISIIRSRLREKKGGTQV